MAEHVSLKTMTCHACGANMVFDPDTQATVCNYCGSRLEVAAASDKAVRTPDWILPFGVSREQYNQRLLDWLIEGNYTPNDILGLSVFENINGIYLPMFYYIGHYHADWSAMVGYDRIEHYTEKDSQGHRVTRSRTVTDWWPRSGDVDGDFREMIYAGGNLGGELADFAAGCSFSEGEARRYKPGYTAGFLMEEATQSEQGLWQNSISGRVNALAEDKVESDIPGNHHHSVSCDISTNYEVFQVFAPYWMAHYDYKGTRYYSCMDGRDFARICGNRPIDEERQEEVSRFFAPAHICLVAWLATLIALAMTLKSFRVNVWAVFFGLVPTAILYGRAWSRRTGLLEFCRMVRQRILRRFRRENRELRTEPVDGGDALAASEVLEVESSLAEEISNEEPPLWRRIGRYIAYAAMPAAVYIGSYVCFALTSEPTWHGRRDTIRYFSDARLNLSAHRFYYPCFVLDREIRHVSVDLHDLPGER